MQGLISIPEFMDHLKREGLVIVNVAEVAHVGEIRLNALRKRYLAKKALTLSQILELEILGTKSKTGLKSWLKNRLIDNEMYTDASGQIMVLTAALKRLGYAE